MRLKERVSSAKPLAAIEIPNHKLTFHKISKDGSGKCNLWEKKGAVAYGVMYEMERGDLDKLNEIEGFGKGYRLYQTKVMQDGHLYIPLIYIAETACIDTTLSPYDWYRDIVLAGAMHHQFPADYIDGIRHTPSTRDPDQKRGSRNSLLATKLNQALPSRTLPWITYGDDFHEATPP